MFRSITLSLLLITSLRANETTAATVNGEAIRLADVDALLSRFKPDGPLTGAQTKTLRESVLDELIDETLIRQHLVKLGPASDKADVDKHMAALVAAQKQQGKTLADFTRETGLTETRLRESFDTSNRFQKMIDARTSEDDYRKYFEAHRDHFEGTTVTIAHILKNPESKSESGIAAAAETLRVLKVDILAGRISFTDAAKKHSLCVSAKAGGLLGTIGRGDGQVEEPLAAAAFALPEKGISEPVQTRQGVHLVQVIKRTPGRSATYEKSRDAVKEAYADDARARLATQLRSKADVRISLP